MFPPLAPALLFGVLRLFFDVRRDVVRPRVLERSRLLGRPRFLGRPRLVEIGPRISENISQPTPAAMRREAIGLLRACFARMGRTSSARLRAFTAPSRSPTTVVGETSERRSAIRSERRSRLRSALRSSCADVGI